MPSFTPEQLARMTQPDLLAALPQILAESQAADTAVANRVTVAEAALAAVPAGADATLLFVGSPGGGSLTVTVTDGAGAAGVVTFGNTGGFNAPTRTGAGTATIDTGGGLGNERDTLAAMVGHAVRAMVTAGDLAVDVQVAIATPRIVSTNMNVNAAGVSLRITDTSGEGPASAARSAALAGAIEVA